MEKLKEILKGLVLTAMVVVLVVISLDIFFRINVKDYLAENVISTDKDVESITVIEPSDMISFEPTSFDPFTRQRLNNVYEALVRPDRDLNMQPGLAVSWGLVDEQTWEFKLRDGVKFHNGEEMIVDDVIASIERARIFEDSQLKDLLSTIESVSKVDDKNLIIKTIRPDPLLLQRISTVYIVPSDFDVNKPVGTGPYDVVFNRFDDYWGAKPKFKKVVYVTVSDGEKRVSALLRGEADLLDYVPYDFVKLISPENFEVTSTPSLEVQFMMFNFKSKVFTDAIARKAVNDAVDQYAFANFVGAQAHGVNQYVSYGIFGYNNEIEENVSEVSIDSFKNAKVNVLLPLGLDSLGDFLTRSLEPLGLIASIQYVRPDYYEDTLKKMQPDLYFMGFKSELGDASDFLNSVVRTSAQYNFNNYSNAKIDELIAKQEVEMDVGKRLSLLKDAMKILVEDDVIGVPLIEYDTVFASKKDLDFKPRIDSFVYLQDL